MHVSSVTRIQSEPGRVSYVGTFLPSVGAVEEVLELDFLQ